MDAFLLLGFVGIEWRGRTLRVAGHGSGRRQLRVVVGPIPIAHPFPDIAGDVIQPIAVGGKLRHGRDAGEPIGARIVIGKVALVGVGHPAAILLQGIAPRKDLPCQAASRRELPLRFGRQPLAGPSCIGERVVVCDMHNRKSWLSHDRAFWTERMAPVCAVNVRPPLKIIVQ